ncbi:MAG: hypothetical protein RIS64_4018 [Bacteroidota bacterium]|jgi:hypothetical protein
MTLPESQTQQSKGSNELETLPTLVLTNKKTIAAQYNVCVKTLGRWLKGANITIPRGLITPTEQALIHKIINERRDLSANVPKCRQKNEH